MRMAIGLCVAVASLAPLPATYAGPDDDSLRAYAVDIVPSGSRSRSGTGVYLGNGLVLTAAHVAPAKPSVRIARVDLPATIVKQGAFEQVDLAILHVDQERLPSEVRRLRVALCQYTPWPGDPVIVAIPESTARSEIMSPQLLPPEARSKAPAVIKDVATTGNSGSGVFDARSKCLLGIMSGKFMTRMTADGKEGELKDLAKYFVPAWTIDAFVPPEHRFW
jgi:trypsin-like peptidase